ncbi:MAG TPA: EAL domain-containing protein [Solirubrobacteraceae bacterium]|nr:EAL domain-containing protein [Solirubrobacteraceae bacterium]
MASDLVMPAARVDDAVLRASLDAIISIDAHGVVLEFNPAAVKMFGYAREDAIGADMGELIIPPAQRDAHRRALRRLLDGGAGGMLDQRTELEAQRADGSLLPVELAITRLAGEGSDAIYTGFVRDLTEHRLAERERHERTARQALVVALGQTALSGLGPPDLVAHALTTLVEGLAVERGVALAVEPDGGMRREAAIGLGPLAGHGEPAGETQAQLLHRTAAAGGSLLLSGSDLVDLAETGLPLVEEMRSVLCVTLQGDRGAVAGLLAIAAADPDALAAEDVGFAQAIANVVGTALARWRADEEITRLGLHDPLTGLANRPLFENRLEQALDRSRRGQGETGLLFVDLDGFSKLNDGFGHRTGDEVLVRAGARLCDALPPAASAGRLAGDEFGVLVPDVVSEEELLELAGRIGIALREPMLAGGRELAMTASIGAVLSHGGVGSVGDLMRVASAAAIRARERGGGRAELATDGMRRRLVHAAEIEQGLRRALSDGELCLHYQPVVDLDTGTIAAVEALVRWQHPDHGLLAPAQFLPAAEATGLAVPLGAEILSIACRELAGWERALSDDPDRCAPEVHVNVSALHFAAPGLAGTVSRALQRSGLAPGKLVLEIAETMFTGEGPAATAQLDDLRGLGVRIALDRFGTGHSSLAAIRRLPFDALKLDSSFLNELGHGTRDVALVEAMIGMGHSLGLAMTAAKVETEQQLRLLRSLGLDRAQGELFAPPLSAGAALELVRSGHVWSGLLEATRPASAPGEAAAGAAVADGGGARTAGASSSVAALSLGQAARLLGISTTTARRWADDGRLGATRTTGGHRRFALSDVRRLLAERGRPAIAPAEPPRRALPGLADLVETHGGQLGQLSWRGLYGELRGGFFVEADGVAAAELWLGALASAARTANYEMLHEATTSFMRAAERAGASLLERHLAVERFAEIAARALTRRASPREEIVEARRLFVSLDQRQLAQAP